MIIWKFTDGKPGHESQTNGLVAALCNLQEFQVVQVPTIGKIRSIVCWLFRKKPASFPSQAPDLIVGAGSKTHFAMVVAKSLYGGKTIVLMRPSIPFSLFDLIIAPKHDTVSLGDNVVEVKGVLNAIPFMERKDVNKGLILIGGISSHYKWDSQSIVEQIAQVVNHDAGVAWVLTTSRRTPENFLELLNGNNSPNLSVVPFAETDRGWMMEQFNSAEYVWVTPDSVSMVYEALSSGASVYIFSMSLP